MVYDVRFDTLSTSFRHSMKYPIKSLATFKPKSSLMKFNRSDTASPMVVVAAGGPSYELSLLNLESGNIEYLISSDGEQQSGASGNVYPHYLRDSPIRDAFNWPEKFETNQQLFSRYIMQAKSLVNSNQVLLVQNVDDQHFKSSKDRYRLLKQAYESPNACNKILVPRLFNNSLQSTATCDYVFTGGNDKRLRCWNLNDPVRQSYLVNTPSNDECHYYSEFVGGGSLVIKEQLNKSRVFPMIDANVLSEFSPNEQKLARGEPLPIPNTCIELGSDSLYYCVLQQLIMQKYQDQKSESAFTSIPSAKKLLTQVSSHDFQVGSSPSPNQFQVTYGKAKIVVQNLNGLSEWQHFNGLNLNHRIQKDAYYDKWTSNAQQAQRNRQGSQKSKKDTWASESTFINQPAASAQGSNGLGGQRQEWVEDANLENQIFRDSQSVSHQDAILDMAVVEMEPQLGQSINMSSVVSEANLPLLVTSSRDGTIKLWR